MNAYHVGVGRCLIDAAHLYSKIVSFRQMHRRAASNCGRLAALDRRGAGSGTLSSFDAPHCAGYLVTDAEDQYPRAQEEFEWNIRREQ